MAAVYFAILLIEETFITSAFYCWSLCWAVSFYGGINHGLYTFIFFLLLLVFIWAKLDRNNFFRRLPAGIIVGYSIMLFMLIVIPGFESFVERHQILFPPRQTNLTLPVPWPWLKLP